MVQTIYMYRINPSGDIVVNLYISLSSLSHRAALSVFFFAICGVPSRKVCQPLRVSLKGVSENGLSPEIANLIGKMDEMVIDPWNFLRKMLIHHGFHHLDLGWLGVFSDKPTTRWPLQNSRLTLVVGPHGHCLLTSSKFSPAGWWSPIASRFISWFISWNIPQKNGWFGVPHGTPIFTWCYMMLNFFYDIVILTSLAGTLWASDLAIHWREPWVWFLVVHFYQSSSRFRCSTFWTCKVRNPIPVTSRWKLIYENHGKPNSSAPRNISGSPRNRCRGCRHLPQLGSSQYWSRWKAMENGGCPWDIYGVLMGFNGIQWMVILW